jgi:hypothetical protein
MPSPLVQVEQAKHRETSGMHKCTGQPRRTQRRIHELSPGFDYIQFLAHTVDAYQDMKADGIHFDKTASKYLPLQRIPKFWSLYGCLML